MSMSHFLTTLASRSFMIVDLPRTIVKSLSKTTRTGQPETLPITSHTGQRKQSDAKRSIRCRALKWGACLALFVWFLSRLPTAHVPFVSESPSLAQLTWNPFHRAPTCKPPSPNLFAYHPPRATYEAIAEVSREVGKYLSSRALKEDIDSISVGVVTPAGILFNGGYGVLKANETVREGSLPVDKNSIYRIASVSKMFAVPETMILRERGVLNLDDPVEKYIPEFLPPAYGWSSYLENSYGASMAVEKPRISLRQLASHFAGIGRDYPATDLREWPPSSKDRSSLIRKPLNLGYNSSFDEVIDAVSTNPLINTPYTYPMYSNTGVSLLGVANVEANKLASSNPSAEPQTHKALLQRDIFDPLGFNSSFFRVPDADSPLRRHMAVASVRPGWVDQAMGDVYDAAGGQYSSLLDLALLMQTLLSPTGNGGVLPASVVREWVRPLHVWGDGPHQVGAPWEISSIANFKAYAKGGNCPGHNSEFSLIPELSVGIIVLMTGSYTDARTIGDKVGKHFLPVLDKMHTAQVAKQYAGKWMHGADDVAEVVVIHGVLAMKRLVVNGVDMLVLLQTQRMGGKTTRKKGEPVVLWASGFVGEFRLALGQPELNKVKGMGCEPYWVTMDLGLYARGAPLDLVYWKKGVLTYPSAGVSFRRDN